MCRLCATDQATVWSALQRPYSSVSMTEGSRTLRHTVGRFVKCLYE